MFSLCSDLPRLQQCIERIKDILNCPITGNPRENPVTARCGHTFDSRSIVEVEQCRFDKTSLKVNPPIKNFFINQMTQLIPQVENIFDPDYEKDDEDILIGQLFELIICPRSGTMMRSPVLAPCGDTFEGSQIQDGSLCRTHRCELNPQILDKTAQSISDAISCYFFDTGHTLLHLAANNGNLKLANHLINNLETVDEKNIGQYTPLEFASANGHVAVAELLKKHIENDSPYFSFGIPITPFDHAFQSRKEEVDRIHELIHKDNNPVVISGLGGVGKSELAKEYIRSYGNEYSHIILIDAHDHQALVKSFRDLGNALGVGLMLGREKHIRSIIEDVYLFLCSRVGFKAVKALVILDDAMEFGTLHGIKNFLPQFLPPDRNRPDVLITSRFKNWPNYIKSFVLDVFTPEKATALIQMSLNGENKEREESFIELTKTLQHLPLALQQAIEYIRLNKIEVEDYLKRYEKDPEKFLAFEFSKYSNHKYSQTTLTTWRSTLDRIKERKQGDQALELIKTLAYLAPETEIPVQLFSNPGLEEQIWLLNQYSMLSSGEDHTKLSVHKLVQQVIRLNYKAEEKKILSRAFKLFEGEIGPVIDHALHLWHHARKSNCPVETFSFLGSNIARGLLSQNRTEEALLFGRHALEFLVSQLAIGFRPFRWDHS